MADTFPIFSDPKDVNDRADNTVAEGIRNQFPVENRNWEINVSNIHIDRKEYGLDDEKKAILQSGSLTYPIKGDLSLTDRATGKIVDRVKNFSLADTYFMTGKHTLLYKGNNYVVSNLLQLRPGVYTRTDQKGDLEAQVNTGTGRSFTITLNNKTNVFYIKVGSASLPLAPLITQVFNIPNSSVEKYVPSEIWRHNIEYTKGSEKKDINNLYSRFVSTRDQDKNDDFSTKVAKLRASFEGSQLSPETTEITLGQKFDSVTAGVFLKSLGNLIKVRKGERSEDNRDSLQFKRVQNLPDFLARRFRADRPHQSVRKITNKLKFNLEKINPKNPKIKDAIPAKPFNKAYTDFILKSSLSATPEETNPIESLENVGKVTVLGPDEGGIQSERGVPLGARNIDPSHLGVIDPSRTPESSHAGIDQRFSITAHRDKEGNLYSTVEDNNGKIHRLSVREMMNSVVGFPHQQGEKEVYAQVKGKIEKVKRSQVKYWVPKSTDMYTVTTNLVPFLNSNSPGRLTMAGKALPQALSLVNRDEPLVQTVDIPRKIPGENNKRFEKEGTPFVKLLSRVVSTLAPADGTVTEITSKAIKIKSDSGKILTVNRIKNLPFNMKGFIDDEEPLVKVGDKVVKGQQLLDNNYTKNGSLALGKNLYSAYLPYKGFNHEDGIVVSQSAADSLKSHHVYKVDYAINEDTLPNKSTFRRYFPYEFKPEQLSKLDDRGFVKEGEELEYGDPIYAVLERREPTAEDKVMGRLHKSLVNPYKSVVRLWDHEEPGKVVDAHTSGKQIRILMRSIKSMEIGDKLTGLHGNKGVISRIVPDEEMPYSKTTKKPIDILLNPASVTSRVNLGQLAETAAGKIAQHKGEPYYLENYSKKNVLKGLQKELKDNGLSDTDEVYDPKTQKKIGDVFSGPQYFLKLYKTTDQNFSARNVGKYDVNQQPVKGGTEGAKSVGYMEFLGLLGSNARKNIREIGTSKAERNTDYWHRFITGQPLPKPQTTFATQRFFDSLKASGVNVNHKSDNIIASPLTDADILTQSNGEIKEPKMLLAKNLEPEKGGLFDISLTGGRNGRHWNHYKLAEPIVNPVAEKPVKSLLSLTSSEFNNISSGKSGIFKRPDGFYVADSTTGKIQKHIPSDPTRQGIKKFASEDDDTKPLPHGSTVDIKKLKVGGHAFEEMLKSIDTDKDVQSLIDAVKDPKLAASKKDVLVKKLKYLAGLRKSGFKTPADAYVLRNLPILPPVSRPITSRGANQLEYADINKFYRDHMLLNNSFNKVKNKLPAKSLVNERQDMYKGAKAAVGLGDAISAGLKASDAKGLITQISGTTGPKTGMFHKNILSHKQDFSGRGTIYAAPDVGFNEAAIPKDMLWSMYKFHGLRDLSRQGYDEARAQQAWKDRTAPAQASLHRLTKEVPVLLNRAPTLMRSNIMAMYPKAIEGKTIGINPLHLPGFAGDYDGDALSVYLPMTPDAVDEAKKRMLPEHNIFDYRRGYGNTMFSPGHEAILGSVHMTEPDSNQKPVEFNSEKEVLEALRDGKITENTPITIKGEKEEKANKVEKG